MALIMKKKPVVQQTTTQSTKGVVDSEVTKTLEVQDHTSAAPIASPTPYAEVGVVSSYTHNLGNFKSCRQEISIKLPCLPAEIDETYQYADKWVEERLNPIVLQLQTDHPA
jgi:hypothetical protein